MPQEVRCSVDSCHYWKSGNHCGASTIMITADSFAASAPDSVDALQASSMSATPTDVCEETCCKTFTHKGSGKQFVDGVTKS